MNSLPEKPCVWRPTEAAPRRQRRRVGLFILCVVGIAFSGGSRYAQAQCGHKNDKAAIAKQKPQLPRSAQAEGPDAVKASSPAGGKSKEVVGSQKQGAGPRWECKQPHIKIDDVWRGASIVCSFDFRNAGTEAMKITVKGG